jgi:hypothetical protein
MDFGIVFVMLVLVGGKIGKNRKKCGPVQWLLFALHSLSLSVKHNINNSWYGKENVIAISLTVLLHFSLQNIFALPGPSKIFRLFAFKY